MIVVYPFNNRLRLGRAHDILVVRTCYHLARAGLVVHLIAGRTGDVDGLLGYYGLSPHPNLHIVQLPILRRERGPIQPTQRSAPPAALNFQHRAAVNKARACSLEQGLFAGRAMRGDAG